MFNPRFPHKLRVWRNRLNDFGEPIYDNDGEPIREIVPLEMVNMVDYQPKVYSDGCLETDLVDVIEFGYRTQGKNTKDSVDVNVSDYKLATPMFITPLQPGDLVEITDYDRTYWGEVVKKATFNLGSNIWINEVKN